MVNQSLANPSDLGFTPAPKEDLERARKGNGKSGGSSRPRNFTPAPEADLQTSSTPKVEMPEVEVTPEQQRQLDESIREGTFTPEGAIATARGGGFLFREAGGQTLREPIRAVPVQTIQTGGVGFQVREDEPDLTGGQTIRPNFPERQILKLERFSRTSAGQIRQGQFSTVGEGRALKIKRAGAEFIIPAFQLGAFAGAVAADPIAVGRGVRQQGTIFAREFRADPRGKIGGFRERVSTKARKDPLGFAARGAGEISLTLLGGKLFSRKELFKTDITKVGKPITVQKVGGGKATTTSINIVEGTAKGSRGTIKKLGSVGVAKVESTSLNIGGKTVTKFKEGTAAITGKQVGTALPSGKPILQLEKTSARGAGLAVTDKGTTVFTGIGRRRGNLFTFRGGGVRRPTPFGEGFFSIGRQEQFRQIARRLPRPRGFFQRVRGSEISFKGIDLIKPAKKVKKLPKPSKKRPFDDLGLIDRPVVSGGDIFIGSGSQRVTQIKAPRGLGGRPKPQVLDTLKTPQIRRASTKQTRKAARGIAETRATQTAVDFIPSEFTTSAPRLSTGITASAPTALRTDITQIAPSKVSTGIQSFQLEKQVQGLGTEQQLIPRGKSKGRQFPALQLGQAQAQKQQQAFKITPALETVRPITPIVPFIPATPRFFLTPPISLGGGGGFRSTRFRPSKQPKLRTPSFAAIVLDIREKRKRKGERTGLVLRPILT